MKYMKCLLVVLLVQVGGVEAGCSWYDAECLYNEAQAKLREEAEAASRWAQEQADNAARIAREAAEAAAKLAADLAARVGCVAKVGATVTVDVAKNLAGKSVSFDELSVEGALGAVTFAVRAKGKIAVKSFDISASIGKDGFTQDGLKQLFYDPLAKLF